MAKTKKPEGAIDYRQLKRRQYSSTPKRVVEFERNMQARMIARAVIHSVKMKNRSNQSALTGKNVYYVSAFLGRQVTKDMLLNLISQSTATATLSDGLAAKGSPPLVERRKTPRDKKAA